MEDEDGHTEPVERPVRGSSDAGGWAKEAAVWKQWEVVRFWHNLKLGHQDLLTEQMVLMP